MFLLYPGQSTAPAEAAVTRNWIIMASLAMIALFVPYNTGFIAWAFRNGYFPLRPVIYLVLMCGINLMIHLPKKPAFSLSTLILLALLAYRLIDVILQRWPEPDGGMERAFRMGATLLFAGITSIVCGSCFRTSFVPLIAMAIVSILTSTGANLFETLGYIKNSSVPGRASGFLPDANDSSIAIVCMLALLLSLNKRFWLNMLMICISFGGVMLTYSRSGFLVLALTILAFLALNLRQNFKQIAVSVAASIVIGIGAITYLSFGSSAKKDSNVEDRMSAILGGDLKKMESAERMKDLSDGVEAGKLQPVFGYGTGAGTDQWKPHNQLVSTWVDIGLPGVIPYLAVLFLIAARAVLRPQAAMLCAIPVICFLPFSQMLMDTTPYWIVAILGLLRSSPSPVVIRFLRPSTNPSASHALPA
jgi:O-antigen ligase